jgi:Na+/H+-dicarboxylate symporter
MIARVALAMALAVTLFMALSPHPPSLPIDSLGDKFEHTLAFVILTILACAAYPLGGLLRIGERLSFLGALIEVLQSIPALHRDCDIFDWLTDTLAISVVVLIVAFWRKGGEASRVAPKRV